MKVLPIEAKQEAWKLTRYTPSDEQMAFHRSKTRIKLAAGGERGGKSRSTAEEMVPYLLAVRAPNPYHFHLIGANYEKPRYEFNYILDSLRAIDPSLATEVSMPNQGKWKLSTAYGNTLETISADDPLEIRGFESNGAAICEAGQVDFDTFLRVLGRLSSSGGFLLISGTFEGSMGWYPQYWTLGQSPNDLELESFSIPTWSNKAIFPGGRQDPKILMLERQYPPDVFMERVAAVPCPPSDRVHKLFDPKVHIISDEQMAHLEPDAPLYLAIDPGRTYAYACEVVQIQNDIVYIVDEIYERDLLTKEIIAIAKQQPWWKRVSQIGNVVDIAGTYRQIASPPEVEIWREESGLNLHFEASKVDVEEGARKLDSYLMPHPVSHQPKIYISYRCKGLIGELGGGPPKFDNGGVYKRNLKIGSESYGKPIDANNHAIKAVHYFLISHFGHSEVTRNRYGSPRKSLEIAAPMGRYWR